MRIPISALRPGDPILDKGKGPIFIILSFILGLFDKNWRQRKWKPWHMKTAIRKVKDGWFVIEALAGGVQGNLYTLEELTANSRAYRWCDEPSRAQIKAFKEKYVGYPYDVTAYFGTVFGYLFQKITGKSFRIIDQEHTCWENGCAAQRMFGNELQPNEEYPVISEIVNRLEASK